MDAPGDVASAAMSSPAALVDLKERFAEALLRDPEPMRAALAVIGQGDMPLAALAALEWPRDAFVLDTQARLVAQFGAEAFLPDKMALARTIWKHASECQDEDSKTKALKLYGEVTGILRRDSQTVNHTVDNRTMIIFDQGSSEEWERKLRAQQDQLLIDIEADK